MSMLQALSIAAAATLSALVLFGGLCLVWKICVPNHEADAAPSHDHQAEIDEQTLRENIAAHVREKRWESPAILRARIAALEEENAALRAGFQSAKDVNFVQSSKSVAQLHAMLFPNNS